MIWLYFQPPSQLYISIPLSCKLLFSRSLSPSLCKLKASQYAWPMFQCSVNMRTNQMSHLGPCRTTPLCAQMCCLTPSLPGPRSSHLHSCRLGWISHPKSTDWLVSLPPLSTYKLKDRDLIYLTVYPQPFAQCLSHREAQNMFAEWK